MNNKRGVAMLIVLLTMTVLIAGVSIIARIRATQSLIELRSQNMVQVNDLFLAADSPIRAWLEERSPYAVVDPTIDAPMLLVCDDRIEIPNKSIRVRICAWDQQGMIPRNFEELGLTCKFKASEINWLETPTPGLDLQTAGSTAFPSVKHPSAIGGLAATHHPWPSLSGTTRSRTGVAININTAPISLIEEVFVSYNLGDPIDIFEKRANHEMARVPLSAQNAQQSNIRLVSTSRVWSMRVDVWIDTIRRSCWCVYANQGGQWRLVQRLIIADD